MQHEPHVTVLRQFISSWSFSIVFQSGVAQSPLTRFTPDACALPYGCSVWVLQLTLDAFWVLHSRHSSGIWWASKTDFFFFNVHRLLYFVSAPHILSCTICTLRFLLRVPDGTCSQCKHTHWLELKEWIELDFRAKIWRIRLPSSL